jgi:hypothetical protein
MQGELYMYPQSWYCGSRRYFWKRFWLSPNEKKVRDHWVKLIDGCVIFYPEANVPTPLSHLRKWLVCIKFSQIKLFGDIVLTPRTRSVRRVEDTCRGIYGDKEKNYIKILGFDENCFLYSDDIDLSIGPFIR